jgi:hypothetical protein
VSALARALGAEAVKLRRTLALWMCAIAPAVVVALLMLQLLVQKAPATPPPAEAAWGQYVTGVLGIWCFLMLPLFVTLQSALLAGLEHGASQWKHLFALPVPRGVHAAAKWVVLVAMVAAAFVVVAALAVLGGQALAAAKPALGLGGPPPWAFLATTGAAGFAASLPIVSLHTWLSLRFRSFTVAVATGMSATVCGFLIGQSATFGPWYPWSMPVQVLAADGANARQVVVAGLVGGLAIAAVALWDLARRDGE